MTAAGFTHASKVMPLVRSSDVAFGIVTREFVPLNTRAFPNLAELVQVVFDTVPRLPFPDKSLTTYRCLRQRSTRQPVPQQSIASQRWPGLSTG